MRKRTLQPIFLGILVLAGAGCRDWKNPSDPQSGAFTESSRAFIEIRSERGIGTPFRQGDTVTVAGGVSSRPVDAEGLVLRHRWDFDGDGSIDTICETNSEFQLVLLEAGEMEIQLTLLDRAGFESEDQLVVSVGAAEDSVAGRVRNQRNSKWIFLKDFPGEENPGKVPSDTSSRTLEEKGPSASEVFAGGEEDCPFYARRQDLMKLSLRSMEVMTEEVHQDGIESSTMVRELVQELLGQNFLLTLDSKRDLRFSEGSYLLSGEDFSLQVTLHHTSSSPYVRQNQAQAGDPFEHSIFSLSSFVKELKTQLSPPFYTFKKGPLFELIQGDLSYSRSSNRLAFQIDFSSLAISFQRRSETVLTSNEIQLSGQPYTFNYALLSATRIAPIPLTQFNSQLSKDSLLLDHSGSRMDLRHTPILFETEWKGNPVKAEYSLALRQEWLSHHNRIGNSGKRWKRLGEYRTEVQLSLDGISESIYASGRISSLSPDTVTCFCDEEFQEPFGRLVIPTDDSGIFQSERYDYSFPYRKQKSLFERIDQTPIPLTP